MLSKKKSAMACVLFAAVALPGVGLAGMETAENAADARHMGFARPRVLELAPGSSSLGVAAYYFRPLSTPVDSLPLPWSTAHGGVLSQVREQSRSWASGHPSFVHAHHGHGHGTWYEDDGPDDLGEHEHEHGHGHGYGHGGTPVPLPAPWVMLMSGLLMLVAARRLSAPQC